MNLIALGLCTLGMRLMKVVFENCSIEETSWERCDIRGVASKLYYISSHEAK